MLWAASPRCGRGLLARFIALLHRPTKSVFDVRCRRRFQIGLPPVHRGQLTLRSNSFDILLQGPLLI